MQPNQYSRLLSWSTLILLLLGSPAESGDRFARRPRGLTPTTYGANATAYRGLGSFSSTPYMYVRGNAPAGGGYSPLGSFGDTSMSVYGPLSSLRSTAAPVVTYTRGYNGALQPTVATGFSTPNLPELSPIVYPTWSTNANGFRTTSTPPWWNSGITWIDQN